MRRLSIVLALAGGAAAALAAPAAMADRGSRAAGGGVFDAGEAAGWNLVRSLRTPARRSGGPIIRRFPTLTLSGDLDATGAREPAAKGRAEGWVGIGAEAH